MCGSDTAKREYREQEQQEKKLLKRSSNKQKRPKTEIHSLIMDYCVVAIVDIIETSVIVKAKRFDNNNILSISIQLYDLNFSDRFQTKILENCLYI